jgi:hypothetical protein
LVRNQKKPGSGEPLNESAKPKQYRKRLTTFSRRGYNQAGKTTIKDKWGYTWTHVLTADEPEAKRLALFYKRQGKEFKLERNGNQIEVFVDFTSNTLERGPKPWENRRAEGRPESSVLQHWKRTGAEKEEIKKREAEEREKRMEERQADLKRIEDMKNLRKGGHTSQ